MIVVFLFFSFYFVAVAVMFLCCYVVKYARGRGQQTPTKTKGGGAKSGRTSGQTQRGAVMFLTVKILVLVSKVILTQNANQYHST